jgi:hypothetical protein
MYELKTEVNKQKKKEKDVPRSKQRLKTEAFHGKTKMRNNKDGWFRIIKLFVVFNSARN